MRPWSRPWTRSTHPPMVHMRGWSQLGRMSVGRVMMVVLGWMRWHPRMMLGRVHGVMHGVMVLVRCWAGTGSPRWTGSGHVVMGWVWVGTWTWTWAWTLWMVGGWIVVLVGRTRARTGS